MYYTSDRIDFIQIGPTSSTPILLLIIQLQHCDSAAQDSLIGAYRHRAVYRILLQLKLVGRFLKAGSNSLHLVVCRIPQKLN